MTATERLRELLDERGVKHTGPAKWLTYFDDTNGHVWSASEMGTGLLSVSTAGVGCLTPEQAIAATLGAGTIDKAAERIEVLSGFAREYLHRYGYLMNAAGEDVTDEVWAIEQVINEVCGRKVVDG